MKSKEDRRSNRVASDDGLAVKANIRATIALALICLAMVGQWFALDALSSLFGVKATIFGFFVSMLVLVWFWLRSYFRTANAAVKPRRSDV